MVTVTLHATLLFEVPLYQATIPRLVGRAFDATSDHTGAQPLTETGALAGFITFEIDTSTNNGSLLFGVMEPDTSEVSESMRPQALLVTYWSSVVGGVQLQLPLSPSEQWSAGGGFQRQRTPWLASLLWSGLQGQS